MTSITESKWAAAAKTPSGPGDARPTAMAILQDEQLVGQWQDKVVLITGTSNGIGVETARALYATGAHVFGAVRDVKKGEEVAADIRRGLPDSKGRMDVLQLDLNSLQSARDCAAAFLAKSKQLNVLICNAGVMMTPQGKTKDGFETQFGTNHVAHFLLFQLLKPALLSSSTPQFNSRVVMVSSSGHSASPVLFGDHDLAKRGYEPWAAYGQSKTANIYMANEIDRRYGSQGLHATSLMPGGIATGLQVHVPKEVTEAWAKNAEFAKLWKSTAQGAATTVWAACSKQWEGRGGRYLEDVHEAERNELDAPMSMAGWASWVYDQEKAAKLWDESCKWVGVE